MKKIFTTMIVGLSLTLVSIVHAEGMLQVKGSDTQVNLVQRLAEVYMESNPGSAIAVTGGGSGTGVAALINGKCDIANSSRLMKPKEISMAEESGKDVKRVVIAIDGLSVITNPGSGVDKLTVDEIAAIFRGEITNWSEVGGPDSPITLYGRQSNSGTFQFFQDEILKGDYSQKMNHMNGNSQIVEAVKADRSGIGYVGIGYLNDVQGITIVHVAPRKGAEYADPTITENVITGKYPISRPLNQYIQGSPTGLAKAFIAFELSPEGQKVVEEEGFYAIPAEYKELNTLAGF